MPNLGSAVLLLSASNVLLFCLAARVAFDARSAGNASRVFLGAFVTLFGLAAGHLYCYETARVERLGLSCLLLTLALAIFVGAWLSVLRRPLTVVLSPDLPQHIQTSGMYRFIRHPFYSSYIATFVAMAISCEHSIGIVCALLIAALYVVAANLEERKFSRSAFAQSYAAYRRHTGMFVPRLFGRAPKPALPRPLP